MHQVLHLLLPSDQEAGPTASRTASSAADVPTAADEVYAPRAPADPAMLASALGQRRRVLFGLTVVWRFRFAQ